VIVVKIPSFFLVSVLLLFACSASPHKGEVIASSSAEPEIKQIELVELAEPPGAAGKASWEEFKAGMQAFDKDPVSAVYYFDLALNNVYSEQQQDSIGLPEDSIYYSAMPTRIILAMESLYPKLINLRGWESQHSIRNDYEGLDSFEETMLDSAEKKDIESHLHEMDMSKFTLPMEINDRVMQEIHYLTVNARKFTEGSLSRKTVLDSMIYAKLEARGVPSDLIYLAFVESGYKLSAYSRAKAAGVWQFIPATGKRYGLPSDFWVDMRRNPERATDAAIEYLSALYNEFGDWYLAMAAYNCGEGRIRRLVKEKQAEDSTKKVSYWDLKLPRETMHYVPRILAATIIGHYPHHYGFTVENMKSVPFDTVTIKDCIPLDKVSGAVGANVNTIRDLNPELIRWCTPPNLKSYTLRVPQGTREKFLKAYDKMDKTQLVRWQQYKVQKGDNLGYISRVFGLKVADIQAANNLSNTRLRVGQILIIPMPSGAKASAASSASKSEAAASKPKHEAATPSVRTYVVRRGDNLSSIARRFGVSSQNLMDWNHMNNNKVMIGQKLKLQDPSKASTTLAAAPTASSSASPVPTPAIGANSYEIKSGDNLWEIARLHNVTVQQLLDWNPGLDKKIYPGMKIKVGE